MLRFTNNGLRHQTSILFSQIPLLLQHSGQAFQLSQPERGVEIRHAVVKTHLIMDKLPLMSHFGGGGQMFGSLRQRNIISENHPTTTRCDDFIPVKTQHPESTKSANMLIFVTATECLGGILYHGNIVSITKINNLINSD